LLAFTGYNLIKTILMTITGHPANKEDTQWPYKLRHISRFTRRFARAASITPNKSSVAGHV
jgi:hypothetical protein